MKRVHYRGTLGHDGSVGASPRYHASNRGTYDVEDGDVLLLTEYGVVVRIGQSDQLVPWWRVLRIDTVK